MIYLVLDIQSTAHVDECSRLSAWVNVDSQNEAMAILHDELPQLGWVMTEVIESTTTTESDYFPPCDSLDAYNEALKGLFALRFKQELL